MGSSLSEVEPGVHNMRTVQRISGLRKAMVLVMMSTACLFQFGSCNLSDFSVSPEITLSAEELISFMVRGVIFEPLEAFVISGINQFFGGDDD
jgi:hypothetical protein